MGSSKKRILMHTIIEQDIRAIVDAIRDEAHVLEGKTVVISGGAGFLGSYFIGTLQFLNQHVLKTPCNVISIDNYITGSKGGFIGEISDPHIKTMEGDITKSLSVDGPADFIVHAAGLASPVYYRKFPIETMESAIMGAKNLLELARAKQAKSFLFFSSSEIYGDPDPNFIPTPETYRGNVSCTGPRACYDESKRLTETLCMTYHQLYGVPVKIVRPFNVYGPGMKSNDYRVVPTFMARGLAGETLPVHDKGNQTRTFCYISDAMAGFFKVLLSAPGGEVYNVGRDAEEINMMTLANMVSDLFPQRIRAQLVKYPEVYPADEPQRRYPDLTKIRRELGYNPRIDLSEGLTRTLAWFRDTFSPDTASV